MLFGTYLLLHYSRIDISVLDCLPVSQSAIKSAARSGSQVHLVQAFTGSPLIARRVVLGIFLIAGRIIAATIITPLHITFLIGCQPGFFDPFLINRTIPHQLQPQFESPFHKLVF
jgi:hypothetical protein